MVQENSPGALALGNLAKKDTRPHQALRRRSRRRPRPRIWADRRVRVLRQVRIAPRDRGVGGAVKAAESEFLTLEAPFLPALRPSASQARHAPPTS